MRLSDIKRILAADIIADATTAQDHEVSDIVVDSRRAAPGTVFFAVPGARFDGHDFVGQALAGGAEAAFGVRPLAVPGYVRVADIWKAVRAVAPVLYGDPQEHLSLVGVTGTNGKTTTTYIVERMLSSLAPTGRIGTLGYRWGGTEVAAENTTPFPWTWYRTLAAMRRDGVRFVASEVSSHALDQDRIAGTRFDTAIFTNFTRDHLDYHKNEAAYFAAKRRLFDDHLRDGGLAVLNLDDPKGRELRALIGGARPVATFSIADRSADLWVKRMDARGAGYDLVLSYRGADIAARLDLPGRFNISNLLGALLAVSPWMDVARAAALAEGVMVPGRMERIGGRGRIFVDYAHSPDALEKVLAAAKDFCGAGRLIVVFGAGGDRDKGKRPLMGEVAARYADTVIVTSDNPRTEKPDTIIADIVTGIARAEGVEVVPDRSAAIRRAIEVMREKDVVVVAGKGAEDYQIIGTEKRHFSDREEIRRHLGEP
ncbi:MAG TPA: UDP-N-acetylmuramoyl-L-alanyl-D-glutamate--2,6-diaminopimelate ligase [bacterium]|nr:UDP-N-acetylmuramoyl-L-alanyl-D-glutamate--2,6-diaminopimelate ligase [bacterium]